MISGNYARQSVEKVNNGPYRGIFTSDLDYALAVVNDTIAQGKSIGDLTPEDYENRLKLSELDRLGGVREVQSSRRFTQGELSQLKKIGEDSLSYAFSSG